MKRMVGAVLAILGLLVTFPALRAQFGPSLGTPRAIAIRADLSEPQARIWVRLLQPLPKPLPEPTKLQDLVQLLKAVTTDDRFPRGIPILVDRNSLRSLDLTLDSPIQVSLRSTSLAQVLTTGLKSSRLRFQVRPEGYIAIFAPDEEPAGALAPDLLNEIRALRLEIRGLREQIVGKAR